METIDGLGCYRYKSNPSIRLARLSSVLSGECRIRYFPATGVIAMMKLLRKIKTDKSGASAAEYALIIALVGGLIITAAISLSGSISSVFTRMGGAMNSATIQ